MTTLLRLCLPATLLLTLCAPVATQAAASASIATYTVDGTDITVIVPAGMSVQMVPQQLSVSYEISRLQYTFTTWEKEITFGLRWKILITDPEANITAEDFWQDPGEWQAGSTVTSETVFEYSKKPGTRLTVVLERVLSDTYDKSCEVKVTANTLKKVLLEGDASAFRVKAEKMVTVSEKDERLLLAQSLKKLFEMETLSRDLNLKPGPKPYYFLKEGEAMPANLPAFRPFTQAMLAEKFRLGEAVRYFRYGGVGVSGRDVFLEIDYHTPEIRPNYHVPKGIRLTFEYRYDGRQFELKGVSTEHF